MPVIRAVLFSSAFHILLILVLVWFAPLLLTDDPKQTVEIEYYPEGQILEALTPKEKQQQVARQALVPKKLRAPEDETLARFLSEQKQRVHEETRTLNSGMTANRSNRGETRQRDKQTSLDMDKNGFKAIDISKDLEEINRLSSGMSTTGESLPTEMKVGSFTALNTDRYLFYTFYARVEEQVRFRWESRVENAIYNFNPSTLLQAGNRNWTTHVEFLLNKNGLLKHARILKESGINAFDGAAVNAFRDAKVFPNPPPEMVQDDGYIHLKFTFTVAYDPRALVNAR